MKMNTKKITRLITMVGLMGLILMPAVAMAQINWGNGYVENAETGLEDTDPREIAANIIEVVLGFLGIIAVAVILIGGFKWMTAGGNEEKVTEGRKWIVSGIIGLAIVLAAWGIATFVINSLIGATGGTSA